jgi:diguanylate cyclase (GGDEF)-like protein
VDITERIIKNRIYWVVLLAFWVALGTFSYLYNLESLNHHAQSMASERAKNFYKAIFLARTWNSQYGPIYAPITEQNPPNPYLQLPNREITAPNGLELTMINHAYMVRQISEIAKKEKVYFHVTSLNPLNPENEADPWEQTALKSFEKGVPEKIEMVMSEGEPVFRYMAPMFVKGTCLACHAQQGYSMGDVRGGISVTLSANEIIDDLKNEKYFLIVAHLVTGFVGIFLGFLFLSSARKHTLVLEGVTSAQRQDLQQQKEKLNETNKVMHDLVTRDTTTGIHTAEHFKGLSTLMWNNAINNGKPVAMLLLEIDSFNDYTDNYGALEGDICLKEVTGAITRKVQEKGSVVARFGAASFAIMLASTDASRAHDLAQRIHGDVLGLDIPHETSDVSKIVTITGVAASVVPTHGQQLGDFIKRARDTLRKGREKGRNHIYRI